MKVVIVGASGETGQSVVNGLLTSPTEFDITALTRPSSLDNPRTQALRDAGVKVLAADLTGPPADLVAALQGADAVISTVAAAALRDQIPLIEAAKAAGVGRFIPCTFATACPPRGVLHVAETKDDVLAHVKALHLPYTVVDVGWWYQLAPPRVPSGRLDAALINPASELYGGGKVPSALTHTRDIGAFVARVLADERTLNRRVFCYGAVLTQEEVWEAVERVSGETLGKKVYVSSDEVEKRVAAAREAVASDDGGNDVGKLINLHLAEYSRSWGVRGDNTPRIAKYLGYLDARELYPDFEPVRFEDYLAAALDGKEKMPWA